jgi:alpha-1,2-mannosyltransferase
MSDLRVYLEAGRVVRHGPGLYTAVYSQPPTPFVYTPFAALIFTLPSHLAFAQAKVLFAGASLAGTGSVVWIGLGLLGHRRNATRVTTTLLITAAALWLEPVQQTLWYGQVNILLMLLVMADYSLPDRSRWKGVGIGLAAGFKLTAAIHIPYLLLTGRRRQAATAAVTFAGTVLFGAAVLPREAHLYWLGGLFDDAPRIGTVSYLGNQSLRALFARCQHDIAGTDQTWLAVAVPVAVLGILLAAWQYRRGRELLGILTTAVTGLLVSPISWSHHWVWAILGLTLVTDWARRIRTWESMLAPGLFLFLFGAWSAATRTPDVVPTGVLWFVPFGNNQELDWHGTQLLQGNLYIVLGLGLLAVLGCCWAASLRRGDGPRSGA